MKLHKLAILIAAFVFSTRLAVADVAEGEKLFKDKCTACHAINEQIVGPALKDVDKRRKEAWIIKWVKNSQALIASGDAEAVAVAKQFNNSPMPPFADLSDAQIKSILEYIKTGGPAPVAAEAGKEGTATEAKAEDGLYNKTTYYALLVFVIILIVIIFILFSIRKVVENLYLQKFPGQEEVAVSWKENRKDWRFKLFKKHPVVGTLVVGTLFTVVLSIYGFDYGNRSVGVQKGYAPTQPIAYSHKLHAGTFKINCQYCHSGADKGKQASIPSASTCMNCHSYVTAKEKYNGSVSPEIQKIYDAIGWDASTRAYIPNYEQKPIKWVRVHNLPDHAYFNHAQHVKVGKVECQACHGPVETMEVVSQQRSLQMGWCINCHREAQVDVASNGYYEDLHKDLKGKKKGSVTVAENGGLECSKCHY